MGIIDGKYIVFETKLRVMSICRDSILQCK